MTSIIQAIFFSLFILLPISAFSAETNTLEKSLIDSNLTFSLPVNATVNPALHITIRPPKDFKADLKTITSFFRRGTPIVEYVPNNESLDNWSKIFTVLMIPGKRVSSEQFTKHTLDAMLAQTKQAVIIKHDSYKKETYNVSHSIVQYITQENKTELFFMRLYSGPYDIAGIQYTVKLEKWLNEAEAKQLTDNINSFLDTLISI